MISEECAMDFIVGCLLVLVEYNMFSRAYTNLYVVYKTVLTNLAYDASLLRAIIFASEDNKTRLRNGLSQNNLEMHMLLNLNREWTQEIDNSDIIRQMRDNNSTEMARLLLYQYY